MSDNNFCLVLCYANWCGHCTSYYIKEKKVGGKEGELEEKKIDVSQITNLKEGDKLPEVSTWQEVREYVGKILKCNVTQFEDEVDFSKPNQDFDLKNMKPEGWPTIMMCKRENSKEKYENFKIFKGDRTNLKDIKKFVEDCINGKPEEQTGGSVDYRMKYKKYKQMYSDLVIKYNALKHKN